MVSQEHCSIWSWFLVQLCEMIFPCVFFHFFKILIFRVVRGVNGRNFSPSVFISQEPCIIWLSVIVHLSKMIQSPGFFHFFKVLIFCVYNVKVQKTVQNDKILSVALQLSGTIHHMIIIYGAHVWNVNIFRRFFSIFQNFDFLGGQRGERAKNGPRWQKILSVAPYISGVIYHDLHLWYTCMYKRMLSLGIFFIFSKFWFSGSLGGERAKNAPK